MGGVAGPIQQVIGQVGQTAQQPGQVPQTANVDFGFNNTQNVPFRPQQIPGNPGFPSPIQSPPPFNYQNVASQYPNINPAEIIDLGGYSGQAYAQQLAKLQGMGVTGLPDFNPGQVQIQPYPMPPVQTRPRPPVIQPGPGVFPQPRPQDSKRGLGGLQLDRFRRRLG